MDYLNIVYFLAVLLPITFTIEYNDDYDIEQQMASQSCKYYMIFYV